MTLQEKALALHKEWNGKLETVSKTPVKSREALSLAYTPGVAEPCKVIAENKDAAYQYTMKANTVAVVSDGSAVLGLGNIGPYAAMPVMEGKAVLFKEFGGVNAVPICLDKMCDKVGIVSTSTQGLNWMQEKMAKLTNPNNETGSLADALKGADIFVGVSAPNIVTAEMVKSMAPDSILFAMANPTPEIMPDVAKAAGARVVGTGRSDFPNQVNNVVAFPGIFKGALEGRATQITEEMKLAAANAIAGLVPEDELNEDNIMPEAFNPKVAELVAEAVKSHIV